MNKIKNLSLNKGILKLELSLVKLLLRYNACVTTIILLEVLTHALRYEINNKKQGFYTMQVIWFFKVKNRQESTQKIIRIKESNDRKPTC